MNKSDLLSAIQKYYLGGKCKDVRWEVADQNLNIDFLTDDGAMLGTLSAVIDLPDNVFAVFNTDRFISLLSVLGEQIEGQYKKYKDKTTGIQLSDTSVDVLFTTGDLTNVPDAKGILAGFRERGRQLKKQWQPAYEIKLDKDSVARLVKAKKALPDARIVAISQGVDSVNLVVNYSTRNDNKITIPFPAKIDVETSLFAYNIELLVLVLTANDGFREGKLLVCTDGLIVMEFKTEDYVATYYLNPLEITQ